MQKIAVFLFALFAMLASMCKVRGAFLKFV